MTILNDNYFLLKFILVGSPEDKFMFLGKRLFESRRQKEPEKGFINK